MIETSRGHSFVVYDCDGGPLSFVLPFPFLDKTHVLAYIGGDPTAFKWIDSNTIEITTVASFPFEVMLRRVTPLGDALVNFQDGARLPATDLNTANKQVLYILQELADFGTGGLSSGPSTPIGVPGGVTPEWSLSNIINQVLSSDALQAVMTLSITTDKLAEVAIQNSIRDDGLLSEDRAFAQRVFTISAQAAGNYAAIQERFTAIADGTADPGGEWSAVYSLQLSGMTAGGTPIVAGIGIGLNPATGSDFVIVADRFAIVNPNYAIFGGDDVPKVPFVVGTVGGVSTVGITGQLLVDGSVTADKITANSISAISANAGTLNGGTFKTHTLDVDGEVIDPTEFRVEMSNIGSYPLWMGAGAKTESNAVFYVKDDGSAKFTGDVEAPNILGGLQVAVNLYSTATTSVTGPSSFTTVHTFTLPAPIRPGESHSPAINVTVLCDLFRQAIITLEYLDGSVWTECSRGDAGDVSGSADAFLYSNSLSLSGSLPPTTSAVDFRIRATHNQSSSKNVTGIRGFAFGIR